ncbi:hypothetical protein [Lentiprolixibacter aurantiacus]|uniref:Uncharacterized protein n=1 Tax=Lentiprolixibacter aurantiacus TaxID=2993939 RepID=A0AAE3MLP9_9FLAO|nr:hypothetical protein [Lentiprolixibacter aurantiacus]MCX2719749.1 hypothetical protein [Lentiprolixibacter aurantiacus]
MNKLFYLTPILREASGAPPGGIHLQDTQLSTLAKDEVSGLTVPVQQTG